MSATVLRTRGAFLAMLLVRFLLPDDAHASWPHISFVNVPVCRAANHQAWTRNVSDGSGGAFVTWAQDLRNFSVGGGTGYDVYLQHVSGFGADSSWPVDGVAVCTLSGDQGATSIVSDGAGGAIIVWKDMLTGSTHVYAQRVSASGVLQWGTNGVTLCSVSGAPWDPIAVSDGAGGAIVIWADGRNGSNSDVFAQRVNAAGVPQWTPNGVPVCTQATSQLPESAIADGAGGAIVAWADGRNLTDDDIYAQRINAAGAPQWTVNGLGICLSSGDQRSAVVTTDGGGGAIIAWKDFRGTNYDIYAQRANAAAALMWTSGGVPICTAGGDQENPAIVSDGSGGAVMAWTDGRTSAHPVFAQRVSAGGAPMWAASGVSPAPSSTTFFGPVMVSDGAGGAILSWVEYSSGFADIYAQRILSSGVVPFTWPANGRPVCNAGNDQLYPTICSDGGGKAIVAWQDFRNGSDNLDIYAQLVAPSGFLAVPNPALRRIGDLPWDQGGFVNVRWDASYLDTEEPYLVDHYWVLRSAPSSLVTSALARGRVLTPEQFGAANDALRVGGAVGVGDAIGAEGAASAAAVEPTPNALVMTTNAATIYYWEPIKRIDALHAVAGYSYVAPTTSDSTVGGNPLTAFMVIAYDYTGSIFLPSDPDSGYSVDNLPPGTPPDLVGNYNTATGTELHWDPNVEPDLANYRVYRGSSASFTPTAASLIASLPDTGFVDAGAPGSYYKLSAVDIHGNESGFALLSPSETSDVGGGPVLEIALERPAPNPARSATRIGFSLPTDARVRLAIYDIAGRKERMLFDGALPAGAHGLDWDLRNDAGSPARPGLYFVRLETAGRRFTQRLMVSGN